MNIYLKLLKKFIYLINFAYYFFYYLFNKLFFLLLFINLINIIQKLLL
jgi:hypothetical protein